MAVNVTVKTKDVIVKLDKYSKLAEEELLDALDQIAGLVQEHARAGHPKVSNAMVKLASRAMNQGEILDPLRGTTSGDGVGEFGGQYRFLTHTGVTRNSIQKTKAKADGAGFSRRLSSTVFSAQLHANKLEFGSASSRAFPFMRPAYLANMKRGQELCATALKRAGSRI